MKTSRILRHFITALAGFVLTFGLSAKPPAGPKGGRLLTTQAPFVEFFVAPDQTAVLTIYDAELRPLPIGEARATAHAMSKDCRVGFEFAAKDNALVSQQPLPAGNPYLVVVQWRASAEAKPTNYRLVFNSETCDGCKRAEYACICVGEAAR